MTQATTVYRVTFQRAVDDPGDSRGTITLEGENFPDLVLKAGPHYPRIIGGERRTVTPWEPIPDGEYRFDTATP